MKTQFTAQLQRDTNLGSTSEDLSYTHWEDNWSIADIIAVRDYYFKEWLRDKRVFQLDIIEKMEHEITRRLQRARLLAI